MMKKIPLQWLGIMGIIGAPGLWLESSFYDVERHQNTSIGGVFDLLYMIGWMCSIYGLLQLQAAGKKQIGNVIFYIQLSLLAVANIWNVWVIIDPTSSHPIFRILDMFWPISNVFMCITGIAVIVAHQLKGYQRFVPLAVGLWLGITFLAYTLLGDSKVSFYIMNGYSTIMWCLMGYVVYRNSLQPATCNGQVCYATTAQRESIWQEESEEVYW